MSPYFIPESPTFGQFPENLGRLLEAISNMFFVYSRRTPGIPQIGRERRPQTPQISSNSPRKRLLFEAAVGDRLATLGVSRAKR